MKIIKSFPFDEGFRELTREDRFSTIMPLTISLRGTNLMKSKVNFWQLFQEVWLNIKIELEEVINMFEGGIS